MKNIKSFEEFHDLNEANKIKNTKESEEINEGKITIIHNNVAGEKKSIEINLTDLDSFINKLKPLLSKKKITDSNRKDIIRYIIKNINNYSTIGGGNITFKKTK